MQTIIVTNCVLCVFTWDVNVGSDEAAHTNTALTSRQVMHLRIIADQHWTKIEARRRFSDLQGFTKALLCSMMRYLSKNQLSYVAASAMEVIFGRDVTEVVEWTITSEIKAMPIVIFYAIYKFNFAEWVLCYSYSIDCYDAVILLLNLFWSTIFDVC